MSTKNLPARPSLEQLKKQAKDLLRAYRLGDRAAFARIREHLPSAQGKDDAALAAASLALHDAQSVIAREHGFANWKDLHDAATQEPEPVSLQNLRALMGPLPDVVASAIAKAAANVPPFTGVLPVALPLVATRDAMLTAGAVAPLHIGRKASIAAVATAQKGDGLLALFAQKNAALEAPKAADLHAVGCAVQIVTIAPVGAERPPPSEATGVSRAKRGRHGGGEGLLWLVVKAIRWVRLDGIEQHDTYQTAGISELRITEQASEETDRLHRALRARVDALVADLPDAEQMRRMTAKMSALELADATVANLPWAVEEKARYAAEVDLERRLRFVLGLVAPEG